MNDGAALLEVRLHILASKSPNRVSMLFQDQQSRLMAPSKTFTCTVYLNSFSFMYIKYTTNVTPNKFSKKNNNAYLTPINYYHSLFG